MNVAAFIDYLNKTKHLHLDADYYGNIEVWRQWWKGDVPDIHDQKEDTPDGSTISRRLASLRMPKHVCEDWANLLLNDKTTLQIGDASTSAYLLGSDEQQTGGLLRQLHFWENANRLVEQAYWSGTGAFVMSVENLTVDASGNALPSPQGSIRLDYDPACCILPISVERGVVTEAAFVSECMMGGKPAVYMQTHTVRNGSHTITNEWFEVTDDISGTPKFAKAKTPPGTVESITVSGSPAWFSLFSPAAVKNLDGGMGLGMSIFSEALDAAQMVDYAFDNYRQDIRLGGKKIFYDRSLCKKWVDKEGKEHAVPLCGMQGQCFRQRPLLLHTSIDLIRAECHQLCLCLLRSPCQPDWQLHIGTVSFCRMLRTVTGIGKSGGVQDHIRMQSFHLCTGESFIGCTEKAFWKGAKLVLSLPLLQNAGADKAACTGDKNFFHDNFLLQGNAKVPSSMTACRAQKF